MNNPQYFVDSVSLLGVPYHFHGDSDGSPSGESITGTDRQVAIFDTDDSTPGPLKAGLFRPRHWSQIIKGAPVENGTWLAAFTNNPIDPNQDMFFVKNTYIPEVGTVPLYDLNGELFVYTGTDPNHAVNRQDLLAAISSLTPGQDLLIANIDGKVDKISGMGLSQTSFTQAEKTKLSTMVDHFAGRFNSLAALNAIVGNSGSYAYVSIGGAPIVIYTWNNQSSVWETSTFAATEETPESIKTKYESNPDTNVFSDAQKAKLTGMIPDATKNDTDANLKNRANHTGFQSISTITDLSNIINAINQTDANQTTAINSHIGNTSNPHAVTKTQVGLSNVDNTSDANKPISTATANALTSKEAANVNIQQHIASTNNPHSTTKAQVGLANVDNTSDLNKPISTAATTALSNKQDKLVSGTNIKTINGVSILGSGNIVDNNARISTSLANNVRTDEYANRFEYFMRITFNTTITANNYFSITTATILPVGITLNTVDEHYISVSNSSRTVTICVHDDSDRKITLGLGNTWSGATASPAGTVCIKLIKYK